MAENYWFFLLGLDFDKEPDADCVKKAIAEKSNYWNDCDQQCDSRYGTYYTLLADQVSQMKRELADQAGIGRHAEIARDAAFPEIDAVLSRAAVATAGGKIISSSRMPDICDAIRDSIAGKIGLPFVEVSNSLIERRASALGIEVHDRAKALHAKYAGDEPYGLSVEDLRLFNSLEADLTPLGKRSLYEFACPPGVSNPERLGSDELLRQAEVVVEGLGRRSALGSAANKLIPRIISIVGDPAKRSSYDQYLKWRDLKEVLESAGRTAKLVGILEGQNAAVAHERIASIVGSEAIAELILLGYCDSCKPHLAYGGLPERKSSADEDRRQSAESSSGENRNQAAEYGAAAALDVESPLRLKVGQVKHITVNGGRECPMYDFHPNPCISVERKQIDGKWVLLVEGLAEGRTVLDAGIAGNGENPTRYAPSLRVEVAKNDVIVWTHESSVDLLVGDEKRIKFEKNGHVGLKVRVKGALDAKCVKWAEPKTSDTLLVQFDKPCNGIIEVYSEQNEEYNGSNVVQINVRVQKRLVKLTLDSPEFVKRDDELWIELKKGKSALIKISGDPCGFVVRHEQSRDNISLEWLPGDDLVLKVTGVSDGASHLTLCSSKKDMRCHIEPVKVYVDVRLSLLQKMGGNASEFGSGFGCLGAGLLIYLMFLVCIFGGYLITTLISLH